MNLHREWRLTPLDDGRAPGRMLSPMKSKLLAYVVIATNPAGWQSVYLSIKALSPLEARGIARRELASTRRDDWDIELVVAAEAA